MATIDRSGNPARIAVAILLFGMLAVAGRALYDEALVAQMRVLANETPGAAAIELSTPLGVSPRALPPRAAVYLALASGRAASVTPEGGHRTTLIRMARASLAAAAGRPEWGEAEVARTYIDMTEFGIGASTTVPNLAHSYHAAPYFDQAAPWRLAVAADRWAVLDGQTRRHVVDEALWLGSRSSAKFELVRNIIGTGDFSDAVKRRRRSYDPDASS